MVKTENSLKSLKQIFKEMKASKIVLVVSDKLILKLGWAIKEIEGYSKIEIIKVPDGEKAKEWDVLENLLRNFLNAGLDRKSLVVAMGGGTLTDLVGFATSIYQRGINYINVPTTLLGMVDSSIGGKTAINFKKYKNQIGSFHNPTAIIFDVRFLKTLSTDQIIDGFGEIIKAGLIRDSSIIRIIKSKSLPELLKPQVLEEIVEKSVKVKEYFVDKDPKDNSARQILNFGHTIGHAIELKYNISHGKAVLLGMVEELKIAEKAGISSMDIRSELEEILKKINFNSVKKKIKIDYNIIFRDKKVFGDEIVLPVIKKIGKAELIKIKLARLIFLCDKIK